MAIDTSVHKSQMTICISGTGGICEQLLFVNNEVIGKKCRCVERYYISPLLHGYSSSTFLDFRTSETYCCSVTHYVRSKSALA